MTTTITNTYSYEKYDSTINKTISFRPIELERDLEKIHNWMNQNHVIPFWKLNFDLQTMRQHLEKILAYKHQTSYIGYLDDVPISYWESYWAIDDIIAKCYPTEKYDQGIHLLIGETEYLGKGYALPLLRAMTFFQFENAQTRRVVTEPDIRDNKIIHVFKKCGFVFQNPIQLPDKTGVLMFCQRDNFFKKW